MAGFLNKILNLNVPLSKGGVLGIDIGTSAIKVVEIKPEGGKAVLKNYGELALGPYAGKSVGQAVNLQSEKIGEALADLLREAKFGTKKSGMAIPIDSSLLSFVEFPTTSEKELSKMIPLEARKYVPVPISEVALDWWVLPQYGKASGGKKKSSEVVIAAIHKEVIEKYQRVQSMVSLESDYFEIEIFGTARSVVGRDKSPMVVIDIGAGRTKLAMIEYGLVKSYHIINMGGQDITTAISKGMGIAMEDAERLKREEGLNGQVDGQSIERVATSPLSFIFSEAESALVNFQKKTGKSVSKVVLVGGGALLKGLQPMAEKQFDTPVELGHPFGKLDTPAFLEDTLKEVGPEFAVAVGVALKSLDG